MPGFNLAVLLLMTVSVPQMQEEQVNRALLAGLAFTAIVFLALFVMQRHRHRWLALFVLVLSFVAAGLVGGWKAIAAAIASSALAIVLSAALLRHIYDDSTWAAFWHQLRMALGRSRDLQVIAEGKTIIPKTDGTLLGPRRVVIKPFNAAVMEQGSKITAVHGPGTVDTQPFEYVKAAIDLRPKQQWLTVAGVLNADLTPLTVVVCVDYSLQLCEDARSGKIGLNEAEKANLMRIAVSMNDWLRAANSAVEAAARQAFCETKLSELRKADKHDALEKTTRELAQNRTNNWGISIDKIVIQRVQPEAQAADGGEAVATLRQLITVYSEAQQIGLSKEDIDRFLERHLQERIAYNSTAQRK